MTLSEAIKAATAIVKCYPNGGRDAGEGYIGALAATLGQYPRQVALLCANPSKGIIRECKFLPTAADLYVWLEQNTKPLRNQREREIRVERQLADRGEYLAGQIRIGRATIDELKEKYGDWHDNWRSPGTKAREMYETARAKLVAEVGEDEFDGLPDRKNGPAAQR